MFDLIIEVLKFLGILLVGLFGILALVTRYRDDNGQITRWGRTAVIGTIVSTMGAFISQDLEFRRQADEQRLANEKSIKQAQANAALLEQVARAVDPLNSFEAWAWVRVDMDTPELATYRTRVLAAIDEAIKAARPQDNRLKNGILVTSRYGDKITDVSIESDSPSFPDKSTEPVAYYLVRYLDLTFKFQKALQDHATADQNAAPDLEINIGTADPPASVSLLYNVENKQFVIKASNMQEDQKFWQNNGNVLAVPDLYKMRATIAIMSGVFPSLNNPIDADILRNRAKLSMHRVMIGLPRGRELEIDKWPEPKPGWNGQPSYDVVLPQLSQRSS